MAKLILEINIPDNEPNVSGIVKIEAGGITPESPIGTFDIPKYKAGDDLWDRIGIEIQSIIRDSPWRDYFGS